MKWPIRSAVALVSALGLAVIGAGAANATESSPENPAVGNSAQEATEVNVDPAPQPPPDLPQIPATEVTPAPLPVDPPQPAPPAQPAIPEQAVAQPAAPVTPLAESAPPAEDPSPNGGAQEPTAVPIQQGDSGTDNRGPDVGDPTVEQAIVSCSATPDYSDGTVPVTVSMTMVGGKGNGNKYIMTVTGPGGYSKVFSENGVSSGYTLTKKLAPPLADGKYSVECVGYHDSSGKEERADDATATFEIGPIRVSPAEPKLTSKPSCGDLYSSYELDIPEGVSHYVRAGEGTISGNVVKVPVGETHVVTAMPEDGWVVLTGPWPLVGGDMPDCPGPAAIVTPDAPEFTDATCTAAAQVTVPAVTGIGYFDGDEDWSGMLVELQPGETFGVAAQALNDDFALDEGEWVWSFTASEPVGCGGEQDPEPDPGEDPGIGETVVTPGATTVTTVQVTVKVPAKAPVVVAASSSSLPYTGGAPAGDLLLVTLALLLIGSGVVVVRRKLIT